MLVKKNQKQSGGIGSWLEERLQNNFVFGSLITAGMAVLFGLFVQFAPAYAATLWQKINEVFAVVGIPLPGAPTTFLEGFGGFALVVAALATAGLVVRMVWEVVSNGGFWAWAIGLTLVEGIAFTMFVQFASAEAVQALQNLWNTYIPQIFAMLGNAQSAPAFPVSTIGGLIPILIVNMVLMPILYYVLGPCLGMFFGTRR